MYMENLFVLLLIFLIIFSNAVCWINENRRIEEEILRNYDRRHRPVKQESTVTQVQLFLTINHIEKVDQLEGTMLLHGVLWISWRDEYLQWTPSEHNNTYVISLETWKIWQPTFALYNSARSTSWFVYMNGVSATVSNDGKVVAAGTFTFQVTCQFDFSAFPYDVQECPIVLADWMFDYSKVNLSGMTPRSIGGINVKPAVRLSFDPLSESVKTHVSGWEIIDTWQRHCLWGPGGFCTEDSPILPLDNYWSLMEFGVKIKRHAPYYGLTLVAPLCITIILTLLLFWLENLELAINIYAINLLLETFSGWVLAQQIPPGDGVMPRIGVIHIWSVLLTLIAMIFHCIMLLLVKILPSDFKFLPANLANLFTVLSHYKNLILNKNSDFNLVAFDNPTSAIIQMDPIVQENGEDNNGIGTSSAMAPQFDQIQLEAEKLSSVPSTSKRAFPPLSIGSAKNETKKGIKFPFSTGADLFCSNEIQESTNMNAQLIVKEVEETRQNPVDKHGADENGTTDKNGLKRVEKARTKKRSPLEQEFGYVRQFLFMLYCLVSTILLALLLL